MSSILNNKIQGDTSTQSFWHALPRPLIGLAPMDGITDHPFRHIQKKYGNPAIMYTEFTSVEALCHGDWQSMNHLLYDESQRPIIAQIYGRTPLYFRQIAVLLCELGFDGIDINMGCPAKSVANGGCGAGLIRTRRHSRLAKRRNRRQLRQYCTHLYSVHRNLARTFACGLSPTPSHSRQRQNAHWV
jgi:hypothetical protein